MHSWDTEQQDWAALAQVSTADDQFFKWQQELLEALQAIMNREEAGADTSESMRETQLLQIAQQKRSIPNRAHRELVKSLLDDMFRLGPLEPLWKRPEVSDLQVIVPFDRRSDQIITYSDKMGRHIYEGRGFRDFRHAFAWLSRHLAVLGQHYDRGATPSLDATFPNGERLHVISGVGGYSRFVDGKYELVPGMIISVRRFVRAFTLNDLTNRSERSLEPPEFTELRVVSKPYHRRSVYYPFEGGMADPATMDYLRIMVAMGKNHLISGGTGVGKTTLANALTGAVPKHVLLLVIEESPEMQPQCHGHVIRLFAREGAFDLQDAMKATLRMFPDRIFIAEVRDALAYTFLRAIQSGHDGSSTTIHANSCRDAIDVMVNFAANHPSHPERDMVRDILYRRIHTIMHGRAVKEKEIDRFFDEVVEVQSSGEVHKVMEFVQVGVRSDGSVAGYFAFHGPTDEFVNEMRRAGIEIPVSWGWL